MKRNMQKFISIILSTLMVIAVLPANVIAAVEINPSVAGSYIINEDFDDSTLDANIVSLPNGAEVTDDGTLKLTNGNVEFNVDSASTWNTLKCISMKLKKDNLGGIVSISNPNGYLNAYWHKNNEFKTWKSINVDSVNVLETISATTEDWITLKMLLNPTMKEYLVLIEDGDKVYTFIESLSAYNAIGNGNKFKISIGAASEGNIFVDDLKVYDAAESDVPADTAILWDVAHLESTLPKTADSSITLPTTGKYGSTISWSSSNTGVIANDGTVTRQSADIDVILTGTIEKGDVKETKDYTVTVLKNYLTPAIGGFGYEENFSNASSLNSNIGSLSSGAEVANDGTLKLTSGSVSFNLDSTSTWNTLKCISMKLKKDNLTDVVSVSNPSGHLHLYWHSNNAIRTWKGGTNVFETISATTKDWITLKMLLNPASQEYLVLIEEANKEYMFMESLSDYNVIGNSNTYKINVGSGATGNIYVDDLKVYDVEKTSVPAETAVLWDEAVLADMIPEKIERDLPSVGTYGSTISWSASVNGIVASDGTVTRPDEDTQVTLTATITNGGTEEKTVAVNALVKKAVMVPVTNGYGYEENFNNPSSINSNIILPVSGAEVTNDGVLKITKTGAAYANGSAVSVGFKLASGANWDKLKCVSMKLKKDDLAAAISVGNASGFFKVYWHINNAIKASASDNTAKDFETITAESNEWVTFKILVNPVLQKYFLQIEEGNNVYTIMEASYSNKGINGSDTFNITMEMASPAGSIYVDDIKVYDVVETSVPEDAAVLWDAAVLDSVIPENIETDLSVVGTYGSPISWSSNPEGFVTSNGIVSLPTSDTEVIFTATITNGDATSQTATITRTVKTADFKFGKVVYNGDGYDNGALKEGAVTVTFPITKVNATTDGLVVISAAYKSDGGSTYLKDVDTYPISFTEGNSQTATMDLTIDNGCFIKTFVLDSLSTLKPQLSPIIIGQ